MASYKSQIEQAGPEDIINNAITDLSDLAQELDDWYDSMPESLQNSEKADMIQSASETIGALMLALEDIDTDDEHFYPDAKITYTIRVKTRKNKQPSRQVRFDNIMSAVTALKDFYESVDDEDNRNELIDQLEQAIEDVEIPGAWG